MRSSRRTKAILASASVLAMWGSAFGATDTWAGTAAPTGTFVYPAGTSLWDTTSTNWTNGGSNTYTVGDSVVFDDNFTGNTLVALPTNTYPASVEFKHVGAGTTNYVF